MPKAFHRTDSWSETTTAVDGKSNLRGAGLSISSPFAAGTNSSLMRHGEFRHIVWRASVAAENLFHFTANAVDTSGKFNDLVRAMPGGTVNRCDFRF
jgi:hypothetical protein